MQSSGRLLLRRAGVPLPDPEFLITFSLHFGYTGSPRREFCWASDSICFYYHPSVLRAKMVPIKSTRPVFRNLAPKCNQNVIKFHYILITFCCGTAILGGARLWAPANHENTFLQLSETYRIITRVQLVTKNRPAAPGAPKPAKSELAGAPGTYFNDL